MARRCLGWSAITSGSPWPDPNQLPEPTRRPCCLPMWGRAGGWSTVVGNLETDRRRDRRWSRGGTGSIRCLTGRAGGGRGAALGKGGCQGRMELGCEIRDGSWAGWVSSLPRVALPPGASIAKNTAALLVQSQGRCPQHSTPCCPWWFARWP